MLAPSSVSSSTREFLLGQLTKAQTRSQTREPLGDVTLTVANTGPNVSAKVKFLVEKASDKILVSALKHGENGSKRKQVQFRAGAVTHAVVPKFCVCDPQKSSPLIACERCSDWHVPTCCNVSGDAENISIAKVVCLPCRQLQILTKLCEKVKNATPPSQTQTQAVCAKLKIPLPLNPTHDDTLVHLAVFLLKAPELRASLCAQETTMEEVVVQLEISGVKRGHQGQIELLNDLSLATLRHASRMCALNANNSKSETVSNLHSFLTGASAPPLPQEPAPRKKAKTKPLQSPGALPKPNPRLAAKRRRVLQNSFKTGELRQECKSRGLSTAGAHKEVVARLVEYLGSQGDGKPHLKDCTCDVCDLDTAIYIASIQVPHEYEG